MSKITIIDINEVEIHGREFRSDPNVQLPEIRAHEYSLDDYDEKICRIINIGELELTHVDKNIGIDSIKPIVNNPWDLTTNYSDKQDLIITYTNGRKLCIQLGKISVKSGLFTYKYLQVAGISFPIDKKGRLLMNFSNTPVLSNLRRSFHEQIKSIGRSRLEVLEIGAIFADILGGYSKGR